MRDSMNFYIYPWFEMKFKNFIVTDSYFLEEV